MSYKIQEKSPSPEGVCRKGAKVLAYMYILFLSLQAKSHPLMSVSVTLPILTKRPRQSIALAIDHSHTTYI